MFKNNKKLHIALISISIIVLGYFLWPITFKVSNKEQMFISVNKQIKGIRCSYDLDEQEVSDFVKILEKSKFHHGVSKPDHMFGDKYLDVTVGGDLGPIFITIYYDTNKTYIFANIPNRIILNDFYRISNKEEIRSYIENIVNTKISEFEKISSNYGS